MIDRIPVLSAEYFDEFQEEIEEAMPYTEFPWHCSTGVVSFDEEILSKCPKLKQWFLSAGVFSAEEIAAVSGWTNRLQVAIIGT